MRRSLCVAGLCAIGLLIGGCRAADPPAPQKGTVAQRAAPPGTTASKGMGSKPGTSKPGTRKPGTRANARPSSKTQAAPSEPRRRAQPGGSKSPSPSGLSGKSLADKLEYRGPSETPSTADARRPVGHKPSPNTPNAQRPPPGTARPDRTAQAPRVRKADGLVARGPPKQVLQNVTVRDWGKAIHTGRMDLRPTITRILDGKKHRHRNDGKVFGNRERKLPRQSRGYYREYVHPTKGMRAVGPQRLVVGRDGDWWYTPDHYKSFIPLQ